MSTLSLGHLSRDRSNIFCNEFSGRSRNRPGAVLTIHTPSCKHVARCASGLRLDTLVQRPIVLVQYEIVVILGFHLVIFHELVTHQPHQLFNCRSRQRFRRQVSGFTFVTTFFVTNFSLLECLLYGRNHDNLEVEKQLLTVF